MALGGIGSTFRNVLEVARFGGLETGEEPSPHVVIERSAIHRLRRYYATGGDGAAGTPVLLVPPLMLTSEVYDVSPQASAVSTLRAHGVDPWIVDFGAPEREPGGLDRTLTDHVLAISDAIDTVRAVTGQDVHLGGYSQGGMFAYQAAAYRRCFGIASLVTFGSPVDVRGGALLGLPERVAVPGAAALSRYVLRGRGVPGWATQRGFQMLDPVGAVRGQVEFLLALHDRERLLPRERQRRFLMQEGWVAWPGPALAEFLRQFLEANRMLVGGFTIGGRTVSLADLDVPVLMFVGTEDEIAPAKAVRALRQAAPAAAVHEVALATGHFGLVVGRTAQSTTWPVVADFVAWASGGGPMPASVDASPPPEERVVPRDVHLAAAAGRTVAASALTTTGQALGSVRSVIEDAAVQLPRLSRLASARSGGRVSPASVFADQVRRLPDQEGFLFEDRAYTYAEADAFVERIVRGLLDDGVRAGERVGVLMRGRPTAIALTLALSRIGAVGVLLRPGADIAREVELGAVTRVVVEPDLQPLLPPGLPPTDLLVFSSDALAHSTLPLPDAEGWRAPAWYDPDTGRSEDLAFVLFAGALDAPRPLHITNGRFALAAFGTAAAAALTPRDTVFCVSPLHHPSGLLTGAGGAIAGGARLAMTIDLDPATFWSQARRYGATVVTYTWTQLRVLLDQPEQALERDLPVRLFVGSGMPAGLWRSVRERFVGAQVLELWATHEGEAVLANVSGAKLGMQGRPVPGSAAVTLVRWDAVAARPVAGPDGFAIPAADGEPGLLLSRSGTATPGTAPVLRNVLAKGDAWLSSGTLFARDTDGDLRLLGAAADIVSTHRGDVLPHAVGDALSSVGGVELAVAYAVPGAGLVAAVQLREGSRLRAADLDVALAAVAPHAHPDAVRVVESVPLTTWHRPVPGPLRARGLPAQTRRHPVFVRGEDDRFHPLTAALHRSLSEESA